jgi:hypothetical protein
MRRITVGQCLAFFAALLVNCTPAGALTGADLADLALQRYTIVVASTKGRCSGVVLARTICGLVAIVAGEIPPIRPSG